MDSNPILLCGLGRTGWRVLDYLRAAGLPVVVVDNVCRPDDPRLQGTPLIAGDFRQREVLVQAGVEKARGILILTSDDLVNIATALMARGLNRSVRVVIRLFNQNLIGRLGKAVENVFALSTSLLTAPMLALTAITGQALGSFRIEGLDDNLRQVVELVVEPDTPYVGQPLAELVAGRELTVLAHRRPGEYLRLLVEVQPETPLVAGDQVVLCGPPRELTPLITGLQPGAADATSWFGWLRRQIPALFRAIPEVEPMLLWSLVALLVCLLLGTLVLTIGTTRHDVGHAFVRTIAALTTGDSEIQAADPDRALVSVVLTALRLTGVVLGAVLTAVLTNFLLRARLGQALEVRRVPEGRHIVVCGLSPVGFRVVEELVHAGEKPVVVERDESNRFIVTVRRLGVPVLTGDATVLEVLRQANAGTARAVVVATNHDLVNLEVALLVRELNHDQRVVVLQSDPALAQMLREAANIRMAVSIHALAAPAFLAGLFGDRVLNVVLVRDRILAVLDLMAQGEDDILLEQSLRTIAVDFHLTPLALIPASGQPPASPLAHRFAPGDRLIAIIALSDLERLLKRQRPAKEYAVEIDAVPLPARPWVVSLLRLLHGCGAEEAEALLSTLPVRAAGELTRGQAEDLLARLQRERVASRLIGPAVAVPEPEDD